MSDSKITSWTLLANSAPPEGVVVETKIHDEQGERNHEDLKKHGSLWFMPDDSMHVYYRPTHWRYK